MTVKKFEFKKTYEEIEAAGKVYRLYFDDERLKRYLVMIEKFKDIQTPDIKSITKEEIDRVMDKQAEDLKEITETLLGDGAFDELYEASGRSIHNMAELVKYLFELVNEYVTEKNNGKIENYYKKVAKK
ncbi:hypothetical protein [Bacillus sonorensis]|uniref:hypothetical protein n=1 Tax=Bacillus sonorensis TaxID=119858 RepID=UPI000989BD85|nr:hypothetical protein [Bacillus sonorensis]